MFRPTSLGGVLLVLLAVGGAQGSPQEDYYRAYYLQNEAGELAAALDLYEKVAGAKGVDKQIAADAALRARCCREDIQSDNLAALMPVEALAYVELRQPGGHLVRLLEQLGLTRTDEWKLPENIKAEMKRFAVSPALLTELASFKGLAVAVTGFDPVKQQPSIVAVLHPGDNNVLRGLIETGIPAAGEAQPPIRQTRVFNIQGTYVALTPRLVVVSQMRTEVDAVLKRLEGNVEGSLAADTEFRELQGADEGRMLFACFNARQAMPLIQTMATVGAAASQEFQMASALLDLKSLRWVGLRAGVDADGIHETIVVRFAEDQNNLVYNFLRTPPLTRSSLARVPSGAAAFLAFALNEAGEGAAAGGKKQDKSETIRRVTGLDLGREFFANVEEVALYLLPHDENAAERSYLIDGKPMPHVGLCMVVRDPSRSEMLWRQLLSLPTYATGQPAPEGKAVEIAGVDVTMYEWPESIRAYFATSGNAVLLTFTEQAMAASLGAKGKGQSILDDEAFAASLSRMSAASSKAMYAHAGRLVQVARAYMDEGEYGEIAPFAHLLDRLVMCFVTDERNEEFRMTTAITGIPDISGVIEQMAANHLAGGRHRHGARTAGAAAGGSGAPIAPVEHKQKVEASQRPAPPRPPAAPAPPLAPKKNKPAVPAAPGAAVEQAESSGSSNTQRPAGAEAPTDAARSGVSVKFEWTTDREVSEPRSYDWQTREPAWSEGTYTLESGTLVVR